MIELLVNVGMIVAGLGVGYFWPEICSAIARILS